MLDNLIVVHVLKFLDDVQIGFLRGGHVGMPQTLGDAGNGHPRINKQGGMGMSEAVQGNNWNACFVTQGFQAAIDG